MGMITPALERAIMKGNAAMKTFTAGGAQMHSIKVPNDKWIVICGFTHFPYLPREVMNAEEQEQNYITQMTVGGDKSFNSFVFRNDFSFGVSLDSIGGLVRTVNFGQPVQIDCYLVHDSDVTLSFSRGTGTFGNDIGAAPSKGTAKVQPTQYGREGDGNAIGAIPVRRTVETTGSGLAEFRPFGILTPPTAGYTFSANELLFPVEVPETALDDLDISEQANYPIVLVQYVELRGNPTDILSNL